MPERSRKQQQSPGARHRGVRLASLAFAFLGTALMPAPPASAQTITEFSAGISPASGVTDIAAGPDGNLWFTQAATDSIGRITPSGVVTEFSAGIAPDADPWGITAGPDGNLWFTELNNDAIGRITPAGAVTGEFPVAATGLRHITAGPDDNLWFAVLGADQIGRITPGGDPLAPFVLADGAGPTRITVGPDDNLWFTESGLGEIGRLTPGGLLNEFGAGISGTPMGITAGPDGHVWFTEESPLAVARATTDGVVTNEFTAGITPGAGLRDITTGPDGNLWFAESGGDRIGRITPAGVVTEFNAGITPGAAPTAITAGPDGNIWFTEPGGNRIGRVNLAAPPVPPPVQGQTVTVSPVSGTVLIKLPGATSFTPLTEAASIPVGSTVDTRKGVVKLTSASDKAGNTQTAQFKFGLFKVTQSAKAGAFTELKLVGALVGCKKAGKKKAGKKKTGKKGNAAGAAAHGPAAQVASRRGRRLWGSGSGRFRTIGSRGSGAARGTIWGVIDRCDRTTQIRSIKGKVTARDFVRKRTVILKSGKRYVAPGPRVRKG